MDTLSLILIFLVLVAFFLILKHFFKTEQGSKPAAVKKEEIINGYKEQMLALQEKYKNDDVTLKKQKLIFLKHVSMELHRNIFFDEAEAKRIVQELASL